MKKFSILTLILIIAIFFRFYQLNQVPPSPSLDEVSIGYNAYSILRTSADEYRTKFPLLLRAYDDWRPALYAYLVIPFVKILGLSVLAVRLPSALLSLITVITTYFLVKELLGNWGDQGDRGNQGNRMALVSAFLLSISPWHIYISRLGHEVNAGLTFSILAIFFFLKTINRQKPVFLFLSTIFFSLSFYTYQSQKIFGPLIIISLVLIFRKQILASQKTFLLAAVFGLLLLIPLLQVSLTPQALIRFQGTNIFLDQKEILDRASLRIARDYQENRILGLIFDHPQLAMAQVIIRAYLSHFNPNWLFLNSGAESHKIPGLGILYLWELPLLLIGSYQLAKSNFSRESKWLILSWVLIAPIPASITTQAPHVMRIYNMLPIPAVLSALGANSIIAKLKKQNFLLLFSLIVFLFFNCLYLYHNYFVNFPQEQSDSFQYPLQQAINYVLEKENQYPKIVFTNQDHGYQSYMFFLFFSQFDPAQYQDLGGTVSGGFNVTHQIDKYQFRPIKWGQEKKETQTLLIGNLADFPSELIPLKTISLLSGEEALKIVEQK